MFDKLEKSMEFAAIKHKGMLRRKFKVPYIFHLYEVTNRVRYYGFDARNKNKEIVDLILSSSMLHDTIEDTETTYEELIEEFGKEVADVVMECSRDKDHDSKEDKWNFLKSFKNKSMLSITIKLADRYCNVNNYLETDEKYAAKYALQACPLYSIIYKHIDQWPKTIAKKLFDDIDDMRLVINKKYNFSKFESEEDIKKEVT